jgi:hypothetical protein
MIRCDPTLLLQVLEPHLHLRVVGVEPKEIAECQLLIADLLADCESIVDFDQFPINQHSAPSLQR